MRKMIITNHYEDHNGRVFGKRTTIITNYVDSKTGAIKDIKTTTQVSMVSELKPEEKED